MAIVENKIESGKTWFYSFIVMLENYSGRAKSQVVTNRWLINKFDTDHVADISREKKIK
jgi:hypothetical protein